MDLSICFVFCLWQLLSFSNRKHGAIKFCQRLNFRHLSRQGQIVLSHGITSSLCTAGEVRQGLPGLLNGQPVRCPTWILNRWIPLHLLPLQQNHFGARISRECFWGCVGVQRLKNRGFPQTPRNTNRPWT